MVAPSNGYWVFFRTSLPRRTRRLCKYYMWLHCVVSSFVAALIVVQTHFLHSCNSWNDAGHVASLESGPGQWVFLPCHFSFSRVKPGNFACVLKWWLAQSGRNVYTGLNTRVHASSWRYDPTTLKNLKQHKFVKTFLLSVVSATAIWWRRLTDTEYSVWSTSIRLSPSD